METNFYILFGDDGENRVFHNRVDPPPFPGVSVPIKQEDVPLIQNYPANALFFDFDKEKIQLKPSPLLQSAAPAKKFDWFWVQLASALGVGVTLGAVFL